jgi:hypothetical protein
MDDPMPNLYAAAGSFNALAVEERERVLGAMTEAQRVLARIPGAERTLEESGSRDADFLITLAERIGEVRFQAILVDADLGQETREAFQAKAAEEGGIVPLLKSRLAPDRTFSASSVACCVSGAVLVVGGGALAVSGALTDDIPLALFGAALAGVGVGAAVACC